MLALPGWGHCADLITNALPETLGLQTSASGSPKEQRTCPAGSASSDTKKLQFRSLYLAADELLRSSYAQGQPEQAEPIS